MYISLEMPREAAFRIECRQLTQDPHKDILFARLGKRKTRGLTFWVRTGKWLCRVGKWVKKDARNRKRHARIATRTEKIQAKTKKGSGERPPGEGFGVSGGNG